VRLTRRTFIGWIGSAAAALGFRSRLTAQPQGASRQVQNGLDLAFLIRLGEVVLPAELGNDGIARVTRAFGQWVVGYRRDAELLHPYGSANIRYSGEPPAGRWRAQATQLRGEARRRFGRSFESLPLPRRRELVTAALANERIDRMPDALGANHVALALVAWFFASPEATDLCYRARIGKNQCRSLVNSPKEPVPLVPRAAGRRGAP
jgi:hypothetical protein